MISETAKSLFPNTEKGENCIHSFHQDYSQWETALVLKALPHSSEWPRFDVTYFLKQLAEFSVMG